MDPNLEFDEKTICLLSRYKLLRPMIRQVILEQFAATIELSEGEIAAEVNKFMKSQGLENENDYDLFLKINHITEEALLAQILSPPRIKRIIESNYLQKAESRYLDRKSDLDSVVYSLIRVRNEELARELYLQIFEDGMDFGELARRYSEGPERKTRGIVGPVSLSQAHPALTERLKTRAVGEIIEPFKAETWWLVARVEDREAAEFDRDIAIKMASELFEEDVEQSTEEAMNAISKLKIETV